MRNHKPRGSFLALMVWLALVALLLAGCAGKPAPAGPPGGVPTAASKQAAIAAPTATPGDRDTVAAYIAQHGALPDYYITKQQARALGWTGGSVEPYAPGKLIGGDRFGNMEGLLPKKRGRAYTECDINTWGKSSRGAERIVFSSDGLIYYTDNHYESFSLLKGAEP